MRAVEKHTLAWQSVRRTRYDGAQIFAQCRVSLHQRIVVELVEMQCPARVEIDVCIVEVGEPIARFDGVFQQTRTGDQCAIDQINAGQCTVKGRSDKAEQRYRELFGERMYGTQHSTEY